MKRLMIGSTPVALAMALAASPALAGDKVLTAPTPAWVAPAPPLGDAGTPASAASANAVPRFDEQVQIDGDKVTVYVDSAQHVSSAEVLNRLGTLSMNWQPAHGDLSYHAIEILRKGQVIDLLKTGDAKGDMKDNAGFSVLRREAGLERLMVDGRLTAVKHIEGLAVGDVLRVAFSISMRDATLAGNVQDAVLLLPAPMKIGFGRARLVWPTVRPIVWKVMAPGLTLTPKKLDGTWTELAVPLPIAKLPEMPKHAPTRFDPLPMVEFSSFADWAAVAKVMAPLFATKGTIPEGSDLAAKVDAIAASSPDPVRRMADALRLVQDEVRYELIALGNGNYVPQTPTDTWTKRYGDCKAKTMLLLAMLDRMGIAAEPVLANIKRGDAVAQGLPAAMAFDHVFVRAQVAGEDYWLDGTMLGSRLADIHDVPHYGYVLPLFAKAGTLVQLPARAHGRPDLDIDLAYDMTAGPHLPAPFHLVLRYAGSFAAGNKVEQGPEYDDKLTAFAEKAAKTWVDSETIARPHAEYDPEAAVWTLTIDGAAYPDWVYRDGHYTIAVAPKLKVAYDAPRDRASWRAIPGLIDQPWTAHAHIVTRLPDAGQGATITGGEPARLDLPAVAWQRSVHVAGGEMVDDIISRETGAEIAADTASATDKTIDEAMAKTTHVTLASGYPQRWDDVPVRRNGPAVAHLRALFDQRVSDKADDATRLADRAWFAERLFDWAGAEADYGKAIALDGSASRYLDRAKLRIKRGEHPAGLADAKAAYDLEQGNNDARDHLAEQLALTGKTDEAIALLPTDPDVTTDDGLANFLEWAEVMEKGNRHAEALAALDSALEKRGSSAPLRNARCWYQALRNGDLDAALADCNKAIEMASDPAGYLDSRAMVHFRAGRLQAALTDYQTALATAPEQPSSLFMSGIIHARLGDKAKAASEIKAARTVFPDIDGFYQSFGIKP